MAKKHMERTFSFSGHETFPFRLGWLHKGVVAVKENPQIFSADEAIVTLGVGKNMVRSIRHWCTTLNLIEETGKGAYKPTNIGLEIFDMHGRDPYLEQLGTMWWLHWRLATHAERCTSWFYVFNQLNRPEFSKSALCEELINMVLDETGRAPSSKTIERDIDCMVRTYTASRRAAPEESLECPLVELSLMKDLGDNVRLSRGDKPTLPDEVFVAALLEFRQKFANSASTISAERIIHSPGSPGRVFILDENSVISRLERLESITNGQLVYDSTAGMRQVLFNGDCMPNTFLIKYFAKEEVR